MDAFSKRSVYLVVNQNRIDFRKQNHGESETIMKIRILIRVSSVGALNGRMSQKSLGLVLQIKFT